jgi:hypothetical protein
VLLRLAYVSLTNSEHTVAQHVVGRRQFHGLSLRCTIDSFGVSTRSCWALTSALPRRLVHPVPSGNLIRPGQTLFGQQPLYPVLVEIATTRFDLGDRGVR